MLLWLAGSFQLYPKTYRTKASVQTGIARKVDFGLYGYGWCSFIGLSVQMKDGSFMPVHEAYLSTGHVIGPIDATAAGNGRHAQGWRDSIKDGGGN